LGLHGPGSRQAKIAHKKIRISCFEVINVLFGGLEDPFVTWKSFMDLDI